MPRSCVPLRLSVVLAFVRLGVLLETRQSRGECAAGTELGREDEPSNRAYEIVGCRCVGSVGGVISSLILCAGGGGALWLQRRLRKAEPSRCGSTFNRRGFSSSTSTRA